MEERRPDLEPGVRERVLAAVCDEVRGCNRDLSNAEAAAAASQPAEGEAAAYLAMLGAVSESIVTHHYLHGSDRIIDYAGGTPPAVLGGGDADALLYVYVKGMLPTSGRQVL